MNPLDEETRQRILVRRARLITKPRISKCAATNKWIMSPNGWRHECTPSYKQEEAFRHWLDALAEGNAVHRGRYERLEDQVYGTLGERP